MKRLFWVSLVLTVLMSLFVICASAEVVSGTCGDNLTWELDGATDELVIYGDGPMYDYTSSKTAPWYPYRWGIETVTISEGVTGIGNYAFWNMRVLKTASISTTVTHIGVWAFCDSDLLNDVVIPDSVITIDESAFSSCDAMTSIVIGNGVTSIGSDAFTGYNLEKIVVDKENHAYESLDGVLFTEDMKTLISYPAGKLDAKWIIPDGVTTIEGSAFMNNRSLTELVIPDSVTTIGARAFERCEALKNVSIGQGVTTIGWNAFSGCTFLSSVALPASVTTIDKYAFCNCQSLTGITVAPGNTVYESLDGVVFSEDMKTLLIYPAGKQDASWRIPDNVTVLGEYSISYNSKLKGLGIPGSVTTITQFAFSNSSTISAYYYGTAEMWGDTNTANFVSMEGGNDSGIELLYFFGSYPLL